MYVDLKLFRLEHDNMFQSDLGELFGVGQSVISRMEKQFAELNDEQYKKLCERFGEEEVKKYQTDNPVKGVVNSKRAKRKERETVRHTALHINESKDVDNDLYEIIRAQARTIENLTCLNKILTIKLSKL